MRTVGRVEMEAAGNILFRRNPSRTPVAFVDIDLLRRESMDVPPGTLNSILKQAGLKK